MRPLVVAMLEADSYLSIGLANGHMELTHRSETNTATLAQAVPLLQRILNGEVADAAVVQECREVRAPVITGDELFQKYRDAGGPENLPSDVVWRIHTELHDEPIDFSELASLEPEAVVNTRLATACYPEHGWPLMLYFALRNGFDVKASLLDNANAGGDSVHRGALLGMLVGGACESFPEALKEGLRERDVLEKEIQSFVKVAISGSAI